MVSTLCPPQRHVVPRQHAEPLNVTQVGAEVPGNALANARTFAQGMFRFSSPLFLAKPLPTASDENSQDESVSEALTQ